MTAQQETKAVKAALREAGIAAAVDHGKGTAALWLHINIGGGQQFGEHDKDAAGFCTPYRCRRCAPMLAIQAESLQIAQQVTGRHGEYQGRINVLMQGPIDQPTRTVQLYKGVRQ